MSGFPFKYKSSGAGTRGPSGGKERKLRGQDEDRRHLHLRVSLVRRGQDRIRNGVVAVLWLRLSAEAKPESFRIRVADALAVFPDAKRISMAPVETVITIKRR